jgi:hypothetical protein
VDTDGQLRVGIAARALRKEAGSNEVESSSTAFTGTISGNGLTLTLNQGLGSTNARVGQLRGDGFTMTFPAQEHALTKITFVPGTVSDYTTRCSNPKAAPNKAANRRQPAPADSLRMLNRAAR